MDDSDKKKNSYTNNRDEGKFSFLMIWSKEKKRKKKIQNLVKHMIQLYYVKTSDHL